LISNIEAKEGIKFLIEALEMAYPAKWVMDIDKWQETIGQLQLFSIEKEISTLHFGDLLANILWAIPDGHLKVRFNSSSCGNHYKNNLKQPTTGNNLANLKTGEFWKLDYRESRRGNLPVLALSGFPQSSEPQWNGFSEVINEILSAPALIVDLRGNIGGDDTKAIELTSTLLGYELSLDWVREIICETSEAYALQVNTYSRIIWNNYLSKNKNPPEELIAHKKTLEEKARDLSVQAHNDSKLVKISQSKTTHRITPVYNHDIFVLIDPQTQSSGEWTALYLKKHPNTKLVGENTYGMIHFGNSGHLQLPNSGLDITLCMKINELTDGRFYEKLGVPPDIKISDKDTLAYTLTNLIVY
jgi:hypothetical protein